MAINKPNSKLYESLGKNVASRFGYSLAALVGFGAAVVGSINVGKSLKLDEAAAAFFDWDTVRAAATAAGGGLILSSIYSRLRYPEDPNRGETRRIHLMLGSTFILGSLASYSMFDSDSNEVTSSTIQITLPAVDSGQGTITSKPPGMCEINIPYKSSDTPSVLLMQTSLQSSGYYEGPIDGINGSDTKQALRDFKTANGFDTATNFNADMCPILSPLLVDGDPNTPVVVKVSG